MEDIYLLWLSAGCAAIMGILLLLGEQTLPLFGGNRALAARTYKTVFMLLITGFVVGLIPAGCRVLARLLRAQTSKVVGGDDIFAAWGRFVTRHDIPGLFEWIAPIAAMLLGIAGMVLAVFIWMTE